MPIVETENRGRAPGGGGEGAEFEILSSAPEGFIAWSGRAGLTGGGKHKQTDD